MKKDHKSIRMSVWFFCVLPPKLDKSVYLRKCPIAILISRQIRLPFWELHVAQKKVIEYSHIIVKKKTHFQKGKSLFFTIVELVRLYDLKRMQVLKLQIVCADRWVKV